MRKCILAIGMVAALSLFAACGNKNADEVSDEVTESVATVQEPENDHTAAVDSKEPAPKDEALTEEDSEDGEEEIDLTNMAINPLTGLYITEEAAARRPVGIMINNHHKAIPQSGISQADVIYETLVEGGIARLFAVFQDFDGEKIGPIRSARHYYLDFAFDFDAIYVHYGESDQAQIAIKELNAPAMNGLSGLESIMCYQDPERQRPHATYTSYDGIMAAWESKGYRTERREDLVSKFNFADEVQTLEEGQNATKVTLDFSYYQYAWFDYEESTEKYMRNQFEGPQIDVETGEQLAFDNIIVQIAKIYQISGDAYGRLNEDLVSEGTGYYITRGKAIPITWSKSSHYDATQYYTEDGSPLLMNTGKTWIAVFPSYRPEGLIIE